MKKVLVTATNYDLLCQDGIKLLQENDCEVILTPYDRPFTEDELIRSIADIDGVIANVDPWTEAVMQAAGKLKVIARFGTGYDTVDLEAAKRCGIAVTNCPGLNAPAVAEHAMALMLAGLRHIPTLNQATQSGKWVRMMFHELSGKKVGILGFGFVGQHVAKILRGFDVEVLAYNRTPRPETAAALEVKLCGFEELLRESDIVSIHLASNADTYHIIDEKALSLLKPTAMVVNTSRGALVDENAMYQALQEERLEVFATDVFEAEPVSPGHSLLQLDRVICTPHASGQTYENYQKTGLETAKAVIDVFQGREPQNRRA